jgi:transposase
VRYTRQSMNTTLPNNSQGRGEQVSTKKSTRILLGLDVHAAHYTVVRKVDGQLPQPPQKFSPAAFLEWVGRQQDQAQEVIACYEAGPLGFGLYRRLSSRGVVCYVIAPQDLDERGQGVKTDGRDARALVGRLDRFVHGNREALAVVRVPSPREEQQRSQARLRQGLQRTRQRLEAQGRGYLLYYGLRVRGRWWRVRSWNRYSPSWPTHLAELLAPLRAVVLSVDQQLRLCSQAVAASAPPLLPLGVGALTTALLEREVCDWKRFKNRRQVGSYCGLCPREASSGARRRQGSITKHGNRQLRALLVELAWRVVRYQPRYRAVRKWAAVLLPGRASPMRRKKAIVAVARELAVDLWRLAEGRATAAQLGLVLKPTV